MKILSFDLGDPDGDMSAAVLAQIHESGLFEALDVQASEPVSEVETFDALRKAWHDCIAAPPHPDYILCSRSFFRALRRIRRGSRFRRVGRDEALDLGLSEAKQCDFWSNNMDFVRVDMRKLKRARRRFRREHGEAATHWMELRRCG